MEQTLEARHEDQWRGEELKERWGIDNVCACGKFHRGFEMGRQIRLKSSWLGMLESREAKSL